MLGSSRAYGSHEKAAAAGWRWNPSPNLRARSHNHEWWPPQHVVDAYEEEAGESLRMPIGTTKAIALLERLFG